MTPWTVAHQTPLSMGILQARILEWVAMPFSRGSSNLGNRQATVHGVAKQSDMTVTIIARNTVRYSVYIIKYIVAVIILNMRFEQLRVREIKVFIFSSV